MTFELPFPPFPHDSRDVPFIATPDDNNGYTVPSSQYFKKLVGEKYLWTPVSANDPMPTSDATSQAKLAEILAKLSADPATQTTLAQILAKIIAAPATEAKQDTIIGHVDGVEGTLTALNGKDFATQTTLATLLTKTGFDAKADITLSALRDALRGTSNKTLTDLATALAPLATATNQDAAQTTLVAILNKIIAAPATEAKQTALNALVGEVQAEPTPNTLLARLKNLETKVDAIIADGLKLSGSILQEATVLNVPFAGIRQQLPDIVCSEIMIIAKRGNTGYIYVGNETVSSTNYGVELGELDCITLPVNNANQIYIDASVSGEGISYVAV